jgi:hypothetical protein
LLDLSGLPSIVFIEFDTCVRAFSRFGTGVWLDQFVEFAELAEAKAELTADLLVTKATRGNPLKTKKKLERIRAGTTCLCCVSATICPNVTAILFLMGSQAGHGSKCGNEARTATGAGTSHSRSFRITSSHFFLILTNALLLSKSISHYPLTFLLLKFFDCS